MQLFAYLLSPGNLYMALGHAIMTALLDEDMSGYELARAFDTSLGFFWKASHQQIYKTLRELEQSGFLLSTDVVQAGKPDKVVYALTDAGRAELDTWVLGESRVRESRDDLYVKLYNLSEHNAAHLREELAQRAAATRERLALYQRIRQRHYRAPNALPLRRRGVYLVLMAGIHQCEQYLTWLGEAEQLLAVRGCS